ncbi:MAG TPA: PAS domain S-box protein, partial [Chitinophagaceae bacterium]|nr:PAS domain S-box protein [Chitinophagaceae bacterium]
MFIPGDEEQRLLAAARYASSSSGPDEVFDNLTAIMARAFRVPVAFISLAGREGVQIPAGTGVMPDGERSRLENLCMLTLQNAQPSVYSDLRQEPGGPAAGAPDAFCFYAGAPLVTPDGYPVGTVSLADVQPRVLEEEDRELLQRFAAQAMHELEQRQTALRQAAVRESRQKLLALVENSIELLSVLELDGRNSYINKAGMQMLGFDNEAQVLTTPISDLHLPEDIAFVQANVLPAVMTQGRWSGRMNVRHLKTGEVFPVFNNTIRIDDPATGQPIAIGAVMRDMRPELATREELVISEDEMRNALEAAEMGYWHVDPGTMILRCSDRTKELFGLPADDEVDLQVALSAIHEKDRDRVVREIGRVLQYDSGGDYDIEYTVISHRDHKERVIRAKGKTYFDSRQQAARFSGTVQDVTAQRQQEQKLRRMLESLPQMAWTTTAAGLVDYYNRGWYD